MNLRFTKMQGAGNDFVVIDATHAPLSLSPAQLRQLGDRRFGVGADQILVVERSSTPGIDFRYRIFNGASGDEVEQCGNGARCFARFVHERGLSHAERLRVETVNRVIELQCQPGGVVTVDMNAPVFEWPCVPFEPGGQRAQHSDVFVQWPLILNDGTAVEVAVLSMGNPHAVLRVDDVDTAPVSTLGPAIERHACFPRGVNVGFLQVVSRSQVRLRVFERDAGETLACGTGACAAVVAGIRLGWLDPRVDVDTRGGRLTIEWQHDPLTSSVFMTGPAQTVFEGEITL